MKNIVIILKPPIVLIIKPSSSDNTETLSQRDKKIQNLRTEMTKNLNKEVGNIFTKSYLEEVYDNNLQLTLTVKDDWYYLEKFQQERLLENAWEYFNLLGEKWGLRSSDDLPWKVIFVDIENKKLDQKGWL